MTKLQAWMLSILFVGIIVGVTLLCLVQNQVCSEMADLMGTKKKYTILSGCRWDMPVDNGEFPTTIKEGK